MQYEDEHRKKGRKEYIRMNLVIASMTCASNDAFLDRLLRV